MWKARSVAQHPREQWQAARMCQRTSRTSRVCSLGSMTWQELLRSPMRTPAAPPEDTSLLSSLTTPGTAESSAQRLPLGRPPTLSGGFHHPPGSCLSCSAGCQSCAPSCHHQVPSSAHSRPSWLSAHLPQRKAHSPSRRCSKGSPRWFRQKRRTGAAPSGGAKHPAPARTPQKGESSQQEQPTSSAPAKKRKLPLQRERTVRKGRKHLCQGKLSGAGAGASSSGQVGTASELHVYLCEYIQAVHLLGQRVTAVGPLRRPPSLQPQPTAGIGPAAPRPQPGSTNQVAPAPPGSTEREEGTAKKMAPSCPHLSLRRSSPLQRDPLSQQHKPQPQPWHPMDFVPCMGPWAGGSAAPTALEESLPITVEQRPERVHMKKLAQEEWQRVARQMKISPVQFLVQREIDMAIADQYGYP
ncbi:serine/arginine repetitive matrix protein 1-like isoform X1 [Lagopus leucura]|uniref:serine/arginine repetitive matrix protein 1-like isoform X1 n=1 Tax=Lagopus leucura TaxID=30410 RepID=UPI001C6865BC|nr:serine/arginine repetitive matrix protein 1-like isoform X1 [Lagopus leucura]XP_042747522.1 serine/arginine repetitive matrix protein 1-like isoform X1 [Lagopus leucura]XP_042747523.1 serine/arginine repetitive matrix protein 1-like isoform X1 [Lagopus leucura]XP_042747524.1 serine/arginine repetitive matrix protein 1-like isoform X1 [Lagopus leucura]XP_042747525.1 serine/arginine repetitive matrix protein 1-like isoform X1 [Lagopus leucura]XP_042747526.1 serine/arginine repetitive matrix p